MSRIKVSLSLASRERFCFWRRSGYLHQARRFAEIEQRYFAAWEAGLVQTRQRPDLSVAALFRAGGSGPFEVALVIPCPTEPEHWMRLREAALDALRDSIRWAKARKREEQRAAALYSLKRALEWLDRARSIDSFMARGAGECAAVNVRDALSKLGAAR